MDIINQNVFDELIARQQESGLSIREFCKQEKVSISKFYSLRRKFLPRSHKAESPLESIGFAPIRITDTLKVTPVVAPVITPEIAPVVTRKVTPKFTSEVTPPVTHAVASTVTPDSLPEIMINLPSGVAIHFRGMCESNLVSTVLTQICQSYVLSK